MAILTQPILVQRLSHQEPIPAIRLIVDTQEVADSFNGTYLDYTRPVIIFGGDVINNRFIPTTEENGRSMCLRVGADYKARRNTQWDDVQAHIYDYRLCAFGPNSDPHNPLL